MIIIKLPANAPIGTRKSKIITVKGVKKRVTWEKKIKGKGFSHWKIVKNEKL